MVIDTSAAYAKISIFAQSVKQQYPILILSSKLKFLVLLQLLWWQLSQKTCLKSEIQMVILKLVLKLLILY